ncbi:hypothetical protein CCYA_CCYA05G1587 [Cyanidiococcus yangmingshanensis]|nr:hypothetical protein CCYA_CCYA05G1587 [Cyanidiococcus yangmingshanensis]
MHLGTRVGFIPSVPVQVQLQRCGFLEKEENVGWCKRKVRGRPSAKKRLSARSSSLVCSYLPLSPASPSPQPSEPEKNLQQKIEKLLKQIRSSWNRIISRRRQETSRRLQAELPAQWSEALSSLRDHLAGDTERPSSSSSDGDSITVMLKNAGELVDRLVSSSGDRRTDLGAMLTDLADDAQSRLEQTRDDIQRWARQTTRFLRDRLPDETARAMRDLNDAVRSLVATSTGDVELPSRMRSAEQALQNLRRQFDDAKPDLSNTLAPVVAEAQRMLESMRSQYDRFTRTKLAQMTASVGIAESTYIVEPLRGRTLPFDPQIALLMAGFSFDAYRDPKPYEGKRCVFGDLQTVYLSLDFVRECFQGVLSGQTGRNWSLEYPPEESAREHEEYSFYIRNHEEDNAIIIERKNLFQTERRAVKVTGVPGSRFVPFRSNDTIAVGAAGNPSQITSSEASLMGFAQQATRRWTDAAQNAFDQAVLQVQRRANAAQVAESVEQLIRESDIPPGELREWDELQRRVTDEITCYKDTERLMFVKHVGTDTEFYIWRSPSVEPNRRLVFAFRGTVQMSWRDFITDAKLNQVDFSEESRVEGARVHAGFAEAFRSIRDTVRRVVLHFVEKCREEGTLSTEGLELFFTGHSLGAALATLAALDITRVLEERGIRTSQGTGKGVRIRMYNFGSPRVGNAVFARTFNELVPDAYRVVNDADVVARLPRTLSFDYHHIGSTVLVNADGKLWIEGQSSGKDPLKERWSSLEDLIRLEQRAFESIFNNEALLHHLEDAYFVALARTIVRI